MKILFCNNLANPTEVDPEYQAEAIAAKKSGFLVYTLSYEEICDGNIQQAIKSIPNFESKQDILYRGWMLNGRQYKELYKALKNKKIELINTPEQYNKAHYLPESYKIIETYTPTSVWISIEEGFEFDQIFKKLEVFQENSIVLKDYVKSEKHHWETACFVPNASDKEKVKNVVTTFLKLRGTQLNKGLVFREFVEFERLTNHSKSNMPLTKEYRLFFFKKKLFFIEKYWNEGIYNGFENDYTKMPLNTISNFIQEIGNDFTTVDLAITLEGKWLIVEIGDAQVSGLPEATDVNEFYQKLSTLT